MVTSHGHMYQELQTKRTWNPAEHVEWLVFEVEGQLQIRPAQYSVAKLLMDDPGAVSQLNMGEGKTRVILPMLALKWTTSHNPRKGVAASQQRPKELVGLTHLLLITID